MRLAGAELRDPVLKCLDRPVWNALTGRQAAIAVGSGSALRFAPEYGRFAAAADWSEESLASLGALAAEDEIWIIERDPLPAISGTEIVWHGEYLQMVLPSLPGGRPVLPFQVLDDAHFPEMSALVDLTEPGPFFSKSHHLGRFVGSFVDGRLAAMAGERMKPGNLTEISSVCTHPDYRGRGLASALVKCIAQGIFERGHMPFLHCATGKPDTISLYHALGFQSHDVVTLSAIKSR